jgi:hypothetical protein
MSRIIEILLFLTPLLSFVLWRVVFPSPVPPRWLMLGLTGFVGVMLIALIWVWHFDAGDANQPYVPDVLRDGRAVPGAGR